MRSVTTYDFFTGSLYSRWSYQKDSLQNKLTGLLKDKYQVWLRIEFELSLLHLKSISIIKDSNLEYLKFKISATLSEAPIIYVRQTFDPFINFDIWKAKS